MSNRYYSTDVHDYDSEFILDHLEATVGPSPDGKPWTMKSYADLINRMKPEERVALGTKFAAIKREQQEASDAHFERMRTDPVYAAEDLLKQAENAVSYFHKSGSIGEGMSRELAEQERQIADLRETRMRYRFQRDKFYQFTRDILEPALIERDRLLCFEEVVQARKRELEELKQRVQNARQRLEEVKQRAAQSQASQSESAANAPA